MAQDEVNACDNRFSQGEADGAADARKGWGMRETAHTDPFYAEGYRLGYHFGYRLEQGE